MTDWMTLGIGLVFALLGGILIALGSQRWRLCPLQERPALETGQRVEFTVAGTHYSTVLVGTDGDCLHFAPPLAQGLPVSFEVGTFAELRLTTPAGVYTATVQFVGREIRPQPTLIARVALRWQRAQRRQHERIPLPDEVSVVLRVADDYWIGWVRDASAGGLRIHAPAAIAPNARLTLELPTALRGIIRDDQPRAARVVACERKPTRQGYAYQIRLAFLDAQGA